MSHEIHETDHMFSAATTPWHGLGTVTDGTLDLDTALVTAKLDWTVSKHPAFTRDRDETFDQVLPRLITARADNPTATFGELLIEVGFDLPIEDTFATIRDDIRYPLAAVGKDYEPFQNAEYFDLAKTLLDGGDVVAETAGSLRNSRTVWLLCRLDKDLAIDGDDHIPYLLFTSSHDGTARARVMPTPVRVVCANTLRMALALAQSSWTATHTASIRDMAKEARKTLNLTWAYYSEFEAEVSKLIDQQVDELLFETVLFDAVPDPAVKADGKISERAKTNAANKRGVLRQIYNNSSEVGEFTGTGWGIVQAFNTYDLWQGRVHGGEDKRLERQASRIIGGETMTNTSRVRELLASAAN